MTIIAYQTLYESALAFGMRKALQAEQKKSEMGVKIKDLEQTCVDLEKEVETLKMTIDETIRKEEEERNKDDKHHKDRINKLKESLQDYKNELEQMLSTPQK